MGERSESSKSRMIEPRLVTINIGANIIKE